MSPLPQWRCEHPHRDQGPSHRLLRVGLLLRQQQLRGMFPGAEVLRHCTHQPKELPRTFRGTKRDQTARRHASEVRDPDYAKPIIRQVVVRLYPVYTLNTLGDRPAEPIEILGLQEGYYVEGAGYSLRRQNLGISDR